MTNEKLPAFIRRDVERAIEDALHPKGMNTHDGKARIGVDRLQYLLRMIDGPQNADVLEFLRAFISGGSQQDFKLWAGELYQKLYRAADEPTAPLAFAGNICWQRSEPNIESKGTAEPRGDPDAPHGRCPHGKVLTVNCFDCFQAQGVYVTHHAGTCAMLNTSGAACDCGAEKPGG